MRQGEMLEVRCACSEISWLVWGRVGCWRAQLAAVGQGWVLGMGSLCHYGTAPLGVLLSRVL